MPLVAGGVNRKGIAKIIDLCGTCIVGLVLCRGQLITLASQNTGSDSGGLGPELVSV